MWYLVYLTVFLIGLLLSLIFTPLMKGLAFSLHIVDYPNKRKVHAQPKPLLGGLAIYISFSLTVIFGLLLVKYGENILPSAISLYLPGIKRNVPQIITILIGGALIVTFGLLDDIFGLPPLLKLSGQVVIGLLLISVGIRLSLFIPSLFLTSILTLFWFLLLINSFNLLDNMDGLSAGVAIIASSLFFIYAVGQKQLFVPTILFLFIGSVLGFLRYNFYPAKIFMGEAGSAFLGYILAITSILTTYYKKGSPTFLPILAPLFILAIPFFDTGSVIIIRKKRKRPIFGADKNHLSHRLVNLGMTHKGAVLFIYLLTFSLGLPAILLKELNLWGGLLLLLQLLLILSILAILEFIGRKNGPLQKNKDASN